MGNGYFSPTKPRCEVVNVLRAPFPLPSIGHKIIGHMEAVRLQRLLAGFLDPVAPVDVPRDIAVGRKRPTWARQTLQEAEGHATPHGTFRERKRPQRYSCYATAMSHIIDFEPSCYEEATSHPVWRDVMMEEYQSIMKNDVWDIVLRPEGKSCSDFQMDLQDQTHS
jgi:hypothetical protein